MGKIVRLITLFGLLAALYSIQGCGKRGGGVDHNAEIIYQPSHALGFVVESYAEGQSTVVTIKNPWQGAQKIEIRLFLRRNAEMPPEGFNGVVVDAPLKRVVCMSSSYIAFIDAIGEVDAIKGVSGVRYVANQTIVERYQNGEIEEVGYDANTNYEVIAGLDPDLVMVYGIAGENSAIHSKLNEMGVSVIHIGDYVENSPLGKSEWVVAFGEMFDKREEAELIFKEVEQNYLTIANMVSEVALGNRPNIMLNAPYRDTWFVPGDRSYMVRLIADAGGDYACRGVDSEQSRAVSGEAAFVYASSADMWLNPGQASTLEELKGLNPRFAEIKAVKNGAVYNCTKRTTENGGSDFWETGAVRADVVLSDMVKMIHPELLPEHELYYFKKIEKLEKSD